MSTYHSPSAEAEKAAKYSVACGFLLILAAFAWVFFAMTFRSDMATSCGDNCTTTPDPSMLLGLSLGAAAVLTVFSAALGVMAGIQTLHNEQMKVLRSAS